MAGKFEIFSQTVELKIDIFQTLYKTQEKIQYT